MKSMRNRSLLLLIFSLSVLIAIVAFQWKMLFPISPAADYKALSPTNARFQSFQTIPNMIGTQGNMLTLTTKDLDMMQAAGVRILRFDFHWGIIQKQPKHFQFEETDKFLLALRKRHIQPWVILGSNERFDPELFDSYVVGVMKHYANQGVIWELWNEPNHPWFWKPKPDAKAYMQLAKQLLPQMRTIDPNALIFAPAIAGSDPGYLKACFQEGLLQYIDGVTIHPYQAFPCCRPPEVSISDHAQVSQLIKEFSLTTTLAPVIFGEWGYSTGKNEISESQQAQYLQRQLLIGLSLHMPINIFYAWRQGIDAPDKPELEWSILHANHTPKPAYIALTKLTQQLSGMHFVHRFRSEPGDYYLLFADKQGHAKVAAWTQAEPHKAKLFTKQVSQLTGSPVYFIPTEADINGNPHY